MYKLIIADDDRHIRERLIHGIDWQSLGLAVCAEAQDGDEAVNLYEQHKPNIIIMDINMPYKDGLEVAREILSMDSEAIIICITGFNDFEYAQKAVKLGIFDMFLKPLDMEEMQGILKKAVLHLEGIRKSRQDEEKLRKLAVESLPVLQKTFLQSLLDGACDMTEAEISERLSYLQADIKDEYYAVAIISPRLADLQKSETDLKLMALSHTGSELIANAGFNCLSVFDGLNNIVFLFSWNDNSSSLKIDDLFSNIRNKLLFYFNLNVYIGIGSVVMGLKDISHSMADAREAYDYKHLFAQNNVVNIKNVIRVFDRPIASYTKEKSNIIGAFKDGDIVKIRQRTNELVASVASTSSGNVEVLQRIFIELTVLILQSAADTGIQTGKFFKMNDPYLKIMKMANVKEIMDWFIGFAQSVIEAISSNKGEKTNKLISIAQKYINENMSDSNLGLDMVSEHVGLSSVYFCQLFHSETGIKFNEYINKVRIDNAKEMLKNPVPKIYEIAERVGYNNPKYFNYVFKKYTGLSPNEFRQNC